MINTKKKISPFFANYDQIESTIRTGTVSFMKRTIAITHQDMPKLEFDEIDDLKVPRCRYLDSFHLINF